MSTTHANLFQQHLQGRRADAPEDVPHIVEAVLQAAQAAGASDVHLVPTANGLELYWRIDGVLQSIDRFPRNIAANIVARLKVLAELLTYRTEVPQEGRIRQGTAQVEMRVSTFPTLFGEKVVVRLFVGSGQYRRLADLGLPDDIGRRFRDLLHERGGLLLVTGPAGSGKTTTVYAALRELADSTDGGRSIATVEDPIEAVLAGTAQSQVQPQAGFTYETGLRSLLRQDPDVILVGEIRDRSTAELVFQAALSGHLVLSTYHAGSAIAALQRLTDMGLEPYQLKSGLLAVVSQRLLRRLCACSVESHSATDRLGLPLQTVRLPAGCPQCGGTGYRGRRMLAEMLEKDQISSLEAVAGWSEGLSAKSTLLQRGLESVRQGETSPAEYRRVFGLRTN